jgi:hypothetical protein
MWEILLRHYDAHHRTRTLRELSWFASRPSLNAAIEEAAMAIDWNGKRFTHQRRIKLESLKLARAALLGAADRIHQATSFDELLTLIIRILADVGGIGELYCYDAAFRIGGFLNLLPRTVYLHSGTRKGAKALGLRTNVATLEPEELPLALRGRPAHEIEDILCIYKSRFS